MNIINIEHISKLFGDRMIFDDASVGIQEGDKIGIVGINGTGKSTLLKMLAGLETPDTGEIITQNSLKIAYLPQHPEFPVEENILSYVMHGHIQDEWTAEQDARMILLNLGMTDMNASVQTLSGGQQKKAALARTLMQSADVLLLDEPTNHLDHEMMTWLEDYLKRYRGCVIMVTHDRYFLDRVTNRILEVSHGSIYSYISNYSGFLELKAAREEMELASDRKRRSILRMELEWAKRGCRARTTKQKARLERLELLKSGKTPVADAQTQLESIGTRMGKKTIELNHISKSYGERMLVSDFSYIVLKNQRLGIIGPNGCGKSTLLKIILGEVLPDEGTVEIGETIRVGYFAQGTEEVSGSGRVIDFIKDVAEYVQTSEGRISASQMLERFLFTPDMQYTPVSRLSGGEKRRLQLLKVLMSSPNVLIMDEPTNDLDIATLTILEDYISSFAGIVITVSHDRYFLDNVVDRIFAFEAGTLAQYEGGFTDYTETYALRHPAAVTEKPAAAPAKEKSASPAKTHVKKLKFTYKEQREYETIDDEIAKLEELIADLDRQILANARDFGALNRLGREKEEAEAKLEEKTERWVYLTELAEAIEKNG